MLFFNLQVVSDQVFIGLVFYNQPCPAFTYKDNGRDQVPVIV